MSREGASGFVVPGPHSEPGGGDVSASESPNCQIQAAPDVVGNVQQAIELLSCRVTELEDCVRALREKLTPVIPEELVQEPPSEPLIFKGSSPMLMAMNLVISDLQSQCRKLDRITTSIEL